jgi:predicted DNA-binding protein with PD1-like motif
MKKRTVEGGATRTMVVVFDKGDEFIGGMEELAKAEQFDSAHFEAIGAFSDVVLGYFSRDEMEYEDIPVDEQVEVLSLEGNIVRQDEGYKVHAHVVVGRRDGNTRGGHVKQAHVWPTLEVVVEESPLHLRRRIDKETRLALIA